MRTNTNWEFVDAAGSFPKVPAGGYVLKIVGVEDHPRDEYLDIIYDVAEGDYKNTFSGADNWIHTFRKYYNEKSAPFFKKFLEVLEASNEFSITAWNKEQNESDFVGLVFGGLIQERYYTSEKDGKDKTALEVADVTDIYSIRSGMYKLPEPRDMRKKKETSYDLYDDVPFN